MFLPVTALIFGLIVATLSGARSVALNSSHVEPQAGALDNGNQTLPYLPIPRPDQTIGEYFDTLLSLNQSSLKARHLQRTNTLTEAIWSDGTANYNISLSRCIHLSDNAGIYTNSQHVTLQNATIQDIIRDLHTRQTTEEASHLAYAARVEENARLAINEVTALLKPAIPDLASTITTPVHDEFRHLLAPTTAYIALIVRAATIAETSVAFFAGIMGRTAGVVPEAGIVSVAITTYGLHLAEGIRQLAQEGDGTGRGTSTSSYGGETSATRGVAFITAIICNTLLAWLREISRRFAGEWLFAASDTLPAPAAAMRGSDIKGGGNGSMAGLGPDGKSRLQGLPATRQELQDALNTLDRADDPYARYMALSKIWNAFGCRA